MKTAIVAALLLFGVLGGGLVAATMVAGPGGMMDGGMDGGMSGGGMHGGMMNGQTHDQVHEGMHGSMDGTCPCCGDTDTTI